MVKALSAFCCFVLLWCSDSQAFAPRQINYQGRLADSTGAPLDTIVDLTFTLYSDSTGCCAGWTETHPAVEIVSGLFTVSLFSITGMPNLSVDTTTYLGVTIGAGPELMPRTRLLSAPYALFVHTIDRSYGGTIEDFLRVNGDSALGVSSFPTGSILAEGAAFVGQSLILGRGHSPMVWPDGTFIAGRNHTKVGAPTWTGTSITGGDSSFVGGNYASVGGGLYNSAGESYARVCGGSHNFATDQGSTVGGGYNNYADGLHSTVAGGEGNLAFSSGSTVGGGTANSAQGAAATIVGGFDGLAYAWASTVLGGGSNEAWGDYAVTVGGRDNRATGNYSLAAGRHAEANHPGTFVWADSSGVQFASTGGNQFLIRASGGIGIGTDSPTTTLSVVQGSATDPIADAWTVYSSRRWKTSIRPLRHSLEKVMELRGVEFNWKNSGRQDIGLIAEEVGKIVPEVVAFEKNGIDAASIDYARLTTLLIEAVKEQQSQILDLKSDIELLKRKLRADEDSSEKTTGFASNRR